MNPPGPRGYPLLGVFPTARRNPLGFFLENARRYGDVVAMPFGLRRVYLLSHPDHLKAVFQEHNALLRKGPTAERVRPFFGDSLTTIDGDDWHRRRRQMRPVFQPQRLIAAVPAIVESTGAMLEQWQHRTGSDEAIEILGEMTDVTQATILRVLFGDVPPSDARAVGRALAVAVRHVNRCLWSGLAWLDWIPTSSMHRYERAVQTLDEFVSRRIDESRGRNADAALLSMLLDARDPETGDSLSAAQLRAEVKALFVAGHTTTASALAWAWYLLSENPGARQELQREVDTVLGARWPVAQDLAALEYTRMLVEETLRLYPPTWVPARTTTDDLDIGGYRIPTNTILLLSPFVTQRDPRFWEDPERFDPRRFAPERSVGRPRYAYFPFGGGPRACIGSAFALMQMEVIVAMVAQRYELTLVPGWRVEPDPGILLQPRHGVMMRVHPRAG